MTTLETLAADALAGTPYGGPSRRVVVAMSGGVDSSVAAALLKHAGHDVIGITLQLYDHGEATGRKGSCCAGQDIHDARRVAQLIGIPHYVLDYEARFAGAVMQSFAESYIAGQTPVPCITCNQEIKFRDLLDTASELGAEVLATGHYVQRVDTTDGPELRRGVDRDRDQSYFLFATTREQLNKLWFPLGGMPKARVRELARAFDLAIADKADSQDICFVPAGRYSDVIEKLKPGALKPGDIVHVDGRRIGRHEGIVNFTVGQRRGLKITGPEPLFVVRIDADRNEVVVGPRDSLRTESLVVRDVNWLAEPGFVTVAGHSCDIFARLRSSQPPRPATLVVEDGGRARVLLHHREEGIATGQACVFYADASDTARVLGGGFIARTLNGLETSSAAVFAAGDGSGTATSSCAG